MAFANIVKFAPGDAIQIVRKGQLYEYKVVDIQIKNPQNVSEYYMQYTNKEKKYLTLMGCYPIGTSKQRILVVAEQIEEVRSSTITQ
jgi:LPXTG-site transpeptidase (sortase) family protein